MALNKDRLPIVNTAPPNAHVEVVTENGFTIARVCELGFSINDSAGGCHFIVSRSSGGVRSIRVEFTEAAVAMVQAQRQSLSRVSAFWLQCAERSLTEYLWDNDGWPPNDVVKIDTLSAEELRKVTRWE